MSYKPNTNDALAAAGAAVVGALLAWLFGKPSESASSIQAKNDAVEAEGKRSLNEVALAAARAAEAERRRKGGSK
ncbi:MAG: hypothetical protein FJ100_23070 [Deltaproteobacteria bacterium]|nr:hypothetical protein [Deltaproteobacteria bacterium]